MSYIIFNSRKAATVENKKARIGAKNVAETVEPVVAVDDTEWLLVDKEADLFLKLALKYWGAKEGGRRAFPCFSAPEYQILGRASDLTGAMRETYKPVAEALDKGVVIENDGWDSCWQENAGGWLVPAGNGDFFSPKRKSFIPATRAFYGEREVKFPNFFHRMMQGKTLGLNDADKAVFEKLQADALGQIRAGLRERQIPYYEEAVSILYDEMENHSMEEEVTASVPTRDLALHQFDFQWSGKIMRHLNLYVLEGLANDCDEDNRIQVHFESHNKSMMFKIFKKLGIQAK